MATPVFKFNHPNYKYDLYIIHNTYTELPITIPMDLTTFIIYHIKSGRIFSGLLSCWEDLNKSGASLIDMTFEDFYTNEEKQLLYNKTISFGSLRTAEENVLSSESIKSFIENRVYEIKSFETFIEEIATSALENFKPLEYYHS